jgi:hypothetical protein
MKSQKADPWARSIVLGSAVLYFYISFRMASYFVMFSSTCWAEAKELPV